jgi:hypothetical protein
LAFFVWLYVNAPSPLWRIMGEAACSFGSSQRERCRSVQAAVMEGSAFLLPHKMHGGRRL